MTEEFENTDGTPIPWQNVKSSNIHSLLYNPAHKILAVRFLTKKVKTDDTEAIREPGAVYTYTPINPETYDALVGAQSVGSAFHRLIKTNKTLTVVKMDAPHKEGQADG